eukprot:2303458-Pleurochrysis_carterae.AAC.1
MGGVSMCVRVGEEDQCGACIMARLPQEFALREHVLYVVKSGKGSSSQIRRKSWRRCSGEAMAAAHGAKEHALC